MILHLGLGMQRHIWGFLSSISTFIYISNIYILFTGLCLLEGVGMGGFGEVSSLEEVAYKVMIISFYKKLHKIVNNHSNNC